MPRSAANPSTSRAAATKTKKSRPKGLTPPPVQSQGGAPGNRRTGEAAGPVSLRRPAADCHPALPMRGRG